jgi:hypothetical protein
MSVLSDFNGWVDYRVPGMSTIITSAQVDQAVLQAVDVWSKYKPQHLYEEIEGDGTYDYALPAAFILDVSFVERLEYPAGERVPTYVDADDYTIYRSDTDTAVLRFFTHTPSATETILLSYTGQHVVDGSGSTILDVDEQAVADLGAAYVCEALSSYFSQATDSTLVVDSRDYKSQATEYALRARRFRDLAYAWLGIGTTSGQASAAGAGSVPASGIVKDFDSVRLDNSLRLTHPQR